MSEDKSLITPEIEKILEDCAPPMATGLVYTGLIIDIEPIEKADNIALATAVCGSGGKWRGIVRKDEYKIGDKCNVYLPDSIVPKTEEFAFMERYNYRVRLMRLRGAPSECLIMPYKYGGETGDDVTQEAGVERYEKKLPPNLAGTCLGRFPHFLPRTDEPNFQSVPDLVDALVGLKYYATEKADGTSCTVYFYKNHFGVCSRNLEKKEGDNVYWKVAKKYGLHEKLPNIGEYALQFEIVGPGIQGNPMGLSEHEARLFDVIDINAHRYFGWLDIGRMADDIGIPTALCYIYGYPFMMNHDELLKFAEKTYANGEPAEGVVFRAVEPAYMGMRRVSFKVINLLYKEKK